MLVDQPLITEVVDVWGRVCQALIKRRPDLAEDKNNLYRISGSLTDCVIYQAGLRENKEVSLDPPQIKKETVIKSGADLIKYIQQSPSSSSKYYSSLVTYCKENALTYAEAAQWDEATALKAYAYLNKFVAE